MADQVRRFAFSHRSVVRGYSSRRLGTQVAFTLPPPSPTTDGIQGASSVFPSSRGSPPHRRDTCALSTVYCTITHDLQPIYHAGCCPCRFVEKSSTPQYNSFRRLSPKTWSSNHSLLFVSSPSRPSCVGASPPARTNI